MRVGVQGEHLVGGAARVKHAQTFGCIARQLGGGGGYYGYNRYGGAGLGGIVGLVLVLLIVLWLFGGLGYHSP